MMTAMRWWILSTLIGAVIGVFFGLNCAHAAAEPSCGMERWAVKVLADPDAQGVNRTPKDAGVIELIDLPVQHWDVKAPRSDAEKKTYRVTGWLIGAKLEADSDLHIVLAAYSDVSKTMIVEIPKPECMTGARSEDIDAVRMARQKFLRFMRVNAKFKKLLRPIAVTVTGVLFGDKLHGQTGVAPNGFELHPVLAWEFSK